MKAPRQEVRIIGGRWKRSKLPVVDSPGLRPTPDRVRETVFNWLGQDLSGWRCLDAFAGSGALGFEAASRGAADVLLVERETRIVRSLEQTRERLHADAVRIVSGDGVTQMKRLDPGSLELVFIDPPYDSDVSRPALSAAARLVVAGGFVYFEGAEPVDAEFATNFDLGVHRQARAGNVHFHLLQRSVGAARMPRHGNPTDPTLSGSTP